MAPLNNLEKLVCSDSEVIGHTKREAELRESIGENRCFLGQIEDRIAGFLLYYKYFFFSST
jgi:hypothetical protein